MTDTDRLDALADALRERLYSDLGLSTEHSMKAVDDAVDAFRDAAVRERDELREAADAAFTDFVFAQGSDFDRTEFPGMARLELYLDDGAALHREDGA